MRHHHRSHQSTWKKTQEMERTQDVSGNTAKRTTATKRYNEQDGRPDLHPDFHHSHTGEARPSQCEYVVEKICPVRKNDK